LAPWRESFFAFRLRRYVSLAPLALTVFISSAVQPITLFSCFPDFPAFLLGFIFFPPLRPSRLGENLSSPFACVFMYLLRRLR